MMYNGEEVDVERFKSLEEVFKWIDDEHGCNNFNVSFGEDGDVYISPSSHMTEHDFMYMVY